MSSLVEDGEEVRRRSRKHQGRPVASPVTQNGRCLGACWPRPTVRLGPREGFPQPPPPCKSPLPLIGCRGRPNLTEQNLGSLELWPSPPPSPWPPGLVSPTVFLEIHASLLSSAPSPHIGEIKCPKQGSGLPLFRPRALALGMQHSPRLGCRAAGLARPGRLCRTGLSKGPAGGRRRRPRPRTRPRRPCRRGRGWSRAREAGSPVLLAAGQARAGSPAAAAVGRGFPGRGGGGGGGQGPSGAREGEAGRHGRRGVGGSRARLAPAWAALLRPRPRARRRGSRAAAPRRPWRPRPRLRPGGRTGRAPRRAPAARARRQARTRRPRRA